MVPYKQLLSLEINKNGALIHKVREVLQDLHAVVLSLDEKTDWRRQDRLDNVLAQIVLERPDHSTARNSFRNVTRKR